MVRGKAVNRGIGVRACVAALFLMLAVLGCGENAVLADRGKYIYDDAERLPAESEIALASYLWRLDSKTDYEIIAVFPKETMSEDAIIQWFNDHEVGKRSRDTGAAVFVFPDNSVFVAIGSGNDRVSVTYSKTRGERIFAKFSDDPVLTLLRFVSALGGKVIEPAETAIGERLFDALAENFSVILLWTAVAALLLFVIQQRDGFQPSDLLLPAAVFLALGAFFGINALQSRANEEQYQTYGLITHAQLGSYDWVHMHSHQVCTGTGKTQTCTTYYTPHTHTTYTNDARIASYELKNYQYRFSSDESKAAWRHEVGEVDALTVSLKDGSLRGVTPANDKSGGKTVGDGVWIYAGRK